jgi:hypothetical protein
LYAGVAFLLNSLDSVLFDRPNDIAMSVTVCPNDFISAILSLSSKLMCLYPFFISTQSTSYKAVSPSVALPH